MRRKMMIPILAVALAFGIATVAFASPGSGSAASGAGIAFAPIDVNDIGVFDPDDPTRPPLPNIQGVGIYFWEREVSAITQRYHSWYADAAAEIAAGFVDADGAHARTENTAHGVGTAPGLYRQSAAGIGIMAIDNWAVYAEISEFTSVGGPNDTYPTMIGFQLELTAHDLFHNAGTTLVTPTTIAPLFASTAAVEVASGEVVDGRLGLAGINYRGALTVVGGTSHVGGAQADLTWTFVSGPTGPQ